MSTVWTRSVFLPCPLHRPNLINPLLNLHGMDRASLTSKFRLTYLFFLHFLSCTSTGWRGLESFSFKYQNIRPKISIFLTIYTGSLNFLHYLQFTQVRPKLPYFPNLSQNRYSLFPCTLQKVQQGLLISLLQHEIDHISLSPMLWL